MPGSTDNIKAVDLERGLYLVRYTSADDPTDAPLVTISAEGRGIDILHDPSEESPELWQPGGCLVVNAKTRGRLVITISPALQSRSTRAVINIEPIRSGALPDAAPSAPMRSTPQVPRIEPVDISSFRLLGHVSRVGDVYVGPDQWIAGPEAPSRVEGFAIEWPGKPSGLDLRYAVALAKPDKASARPRSLTEFAGSRGKSMPILGVQLELVGAEAYQCQLVAEALYLGAPMMRTAGSRIELKGPTGREPLVGLRVGIQTRNGASRPAAPPPAPPPSMMSMSPPPEERNSGRVRVFRRRP